MNAMKDALEKIAAAADTMSPTEGFAFATSLAKSTLNAEDEWAWVHQMFDIAVAGVRRTLAASKDHPTLAPTPSQEEAALVACDILEKLKTIIVEDQPLPDKFATHPSDTLEGALVVHSHLETMSPSEGMAAVAIIGLLKILLRNFAEKAPDSEEDPGLH